MSDDFKRIKDEIYHDVKEYPDAVCILEESDSSIFVEDDTDGYSWRYEFTDTDAMDSAWLSDRIVVTPSTQETGILNIESLKEFILSFIPKETYQTLNRLVFVSDLEKDWDYLWEYKDERIDTDFSDLLEMHSLPDGLLGINWSTNCVVVVNVGEIINTVREMLESGEIYDYEYSSEVIIGLKTTIAHEFRHLQQNNPYVSEAVRKTFLDDPEIDAESFARDIVDGVLHRMR